MSSSPPSWSRANFTDIKHLQQERYLRSQSKIITKPPTPLSPFLARRVRKISSWFCLRNLSQTAGQSFEGLLISRGSSCRDHPTTFKYHHLHLSHNQSSYEPPLETSFYAFYVSFPLHFYVRWSLAEEKYVKLF